MDRNEYMRKWNKENKDKKKVNDRRYYLKHKQELIEKNTIWAEQNHEKVLEYKKTYRKKNPHTVRFKNDIIWIKGRNPRVGKCSLCDRTTKSNEIKITHLHHIIYDVSNPLAHTIELCVSCHRKQHTKFR